MSKRIGIIIRSLKPGGAEKQSALLASVLAANYKVFLFIQYNEISPSNKLLISHSNIQLINLSGNIFSKTQRLRIIILEEHISHIFAYLSSDNLIASLANFRIKSCVVYGGVRSSLLPKHKLLVIKLLHHFFQKGTIFNNHKGQNTFHKLGFNKKKSIVIPNGISLKKHDSRYAHNGTIKIISVGRFVDAKDYFTAIKAIKELKKISSIAFKLYIIGFGPLESEIKELIEILELQQTIVIKIKPDNINDYYQSADIYLCTSSFEGLSNSIMEAINYRLPIVATKVGDNDRLVINQHNGILTEVGQYKAIANALKELMNNKELREQYGNNGYYHLKENYSIQEFTNRYIKLIEN